jgi:molecular chaperone GrpE
MYSLGEGMSGKADKKKATEKKQPGQESEPLEEVMQEAAEEQESTELSEVEKLQSAVESLTAEVEDYKNQYLRKHADFENFRKRMLREKEDAIRYANASLLKDIIGVIDDFERAISSAKESRDFEGFLSGIQLIEKQFVSMLENNWGLRRMETVGEEFDPQRHEALMMEENPDCDKETVLEDYQRGYSLNDRVIRHAKVKVGKPLAETERQDG